MPHPAVMPAVIGAVKLAGKMRSLLKKLPKGAKKTKKTRGPAKASARGKKTQKLNPAVTRKGRGAITDAHPTDNTLMREGRLPRGTQPLPATTNPQRPVTKALKDAKVKGARKTR